MSYGTILVLTGPRPLPEGKHATFFFPVSGAPERNRPEGSQETPNFPGSHQAALAEVYSDIVWHHWRPPHNRGRPEIFQASAESRYPRCGDRFWLFLQMQGERIAAAYFESHGCAPVTATGSVGTELLRGLTCEQARQLNSFQLDQALGGLPPPKRHALLLFLEALHGALDACERNSS